MIPMPMRITFFLPANIPISMGFLLTAPTIFNTVFWQVVNQTYNALLNYGNANKSSPATTEDIFKSYCMAVAASVSTSIGVRLATKRQTERAKGARLVVLNAIVTMIACGAGGFANNWFMRQPEIAQGISVTDPNDGKTLGKSKIAALDATWETASSRVLMAAPVGIPGFILFGLERKGLLPANAALLLMLQLSLIALQLSQAVPLSMAYFPQFRTVDARKLEPEFWDLTSSATGEKIREFRYNKGL